MTPAPIGIPGTWTNVFADEFASGKLDTTKWSVGWLASGVTKPVNSAEVCCYAPECVTVSGSNLRLHLINKAQKANDGKTYPYSSGLVHTAGKHEFTYGAFEARVFSPGHGSIYNWPAFWMDGHSWPLDGEIDIFEGLSGSAAWHFHFQDSSGHPAQDGGDVHGDYSGWHVYGAHWAAGQIHYYYDGHLVGSVVGPQVTSKPMFLILNYGASGHPLVPNSMQVDYVRVWK